MHCVNKSVIESDKTNVYLQEDLCAFMTSRRILLNTRNFSDKLCREYQNTYFMFNHFFFFENDFIYEIMKGPARRQVAI